MYHWHSWDTVNRRPFHLRPYRRCTLARSRPGFDRRDNPADLRGNEPATPDASPERVNDHVCPWCGSADTVRVQRGFVGPTDDRNQYLRCRACSRLTFEIISKTVRDMRVGQFRAGGTYRDTVSQTKYSITRVLKVGMNECLLYVKPIMRTDVGADRGRDRD
jgi:ribosomal protein L37AE/L43A